jgi:hypothetical protein
MPWFYNNYSGELKQESGPAALAYEAALHTGTGWHEYSTQAQAVAAAKANGWPAPTSSFGGGLGNAVGGGVEQLGAKAASQLGSTVLGPLFQANIWERAGEVLLGLVLIAIGVARLTHAVPIATKVAGAVA